MKKPIIAISADSLTEPSPVINENFADFAPRDLKEAIIESGGIPIILPFPEDIRLASSFAQAAVDLFDGLIIPGGPDIDPTLFGQEPIHELGRTAYQRDAYEISLAEAAKASGKPVFGICRGLQLLNVAFGGTLYQDLQAQHQEAFIKHAQAAPGHFPTHHVGLVPGSQAYEVFGEMAYVNSRHHQAVKDLADLFVVTGRAQDGVIEAIESQDGLISAVQWHPENMRQHDEKQLALFEKFIKKCRQ